MKFNNQQMTTNIASPTSTGSKLDQGRFKVLIYKIISVANYQAMTPTETERAKNITIYQASAGGVIA